MALLFTKVDWNLLGDREDGSWDIIEGLMYAGSQAICMIGSIYVWRMSTTQPLRRGKH
jgi:hypothetical protein